MQTELQNSLGKWNTVEPSKGPAHDLLKDFVGRWHVEGQNGATSPGSKGEHVTGEEIYEWLEGKYFLINRWDRRYASERFRGIGWIGYDAKTHAYFSASISNSGHFRTYDVKVTRGLIELTGPLERATVKLSESGKKLNVHWEHRTGDGQWHLLCSLMGRRAH